ncbi:MAG: ATP-binding cassette domain-containing protein [Nevskia sp.]|nr:ATP-binding cassette domain-containing protein [Nevskia sp.]
MDASEQGRRTAGTEAASGAEIVSAQGVRKQIATGAADAPVLTILDGLCLRICAGESVAIVGASGSGKTTLLSLLAGLDSPSAGDIRLAGASLAALDEDARARLRAGRVGFVFQSFQLLAGLTALENVMLPGELAGLADAEARARRTLGQVGLGERLGHYPHQLSGGEQQRVAIARAFAAEPQVLFADEPTGNLDLVTGGRIAELLFELNRSRGTTLVLVTHDMSLARRCGRVLTLSDGRLHEDA